MNHLFCKASSLSAQLGVTNIYRDILTFSLVFVILNAVFVINYILFLFSFHALWEAKYSLFLSYLATDLVGATEITLVQRDV